MKQLSVFFVIAAISSTSLAQLTPGLRPGGPGPLSPIPVVVPTPVVVPEPVAVPAPIVVPSPGHGGGHDNGQVNAESLRQLARSVLDEVEATSDLLDSRQLGRVTQLLREIGLTMSGNASMPIPTVPTIPTVPNLPPSYQPMFPVPYGPFFCDSNNNVLLDGGFRQIYDFNNRSDCLEAIQQIQKGQAFCDTNNNTLRKPFGDLIYDFSSTPNCQLGITRVSLGKPFCDYNDNTLRQPNGQLIYDFSNEQDCTAAMYRY